MFRDVSAACCIYLSSDLVAVALKDRGMVPESSAARLRASPRTRRAARSNPGRLRSVRLVPGAIG
jgi:hypothetical protein